MIACRTTGGMDGRAGPRCGCARSSTPTSPGGSQNEIYEIRRGDLHGALRIPPTTAPESRDGGIIREWRIIEALDGTDVPHTPAIAVCEDKSVLGRSFYLMGYVDGWSPMNTDGWPAPFDTDLEARRGLAFELVDGIALLSQGRLAGEGPATSGTPTGSTTARSTGGRHSSSASRAGTLPGFDEATAWLRAHRPLDFIPGLMHGDYQFANVMYRHGAPARMAAIVDWEMGTVGDPKLDLAWVVHGWPEDTDDEPRHRLRGHDRHAVTDGDCWTGTPRCPAGRSTTSTTSGPGQVEAGHRPRAGVPAGG